MHQKRTRVWIDPFQTALFWRIAYRFLLYQMMVWVLVIFGWSIHSRLTMIAGAELATQAMWFLAGIVVVMGILCIYDVVIFTHRIVGPVVAFRKVCRAIRDGESVEFVRLRQGDFLQDLKNEFNDMLKALEQRGALTLETAAVKPSETEQPRIAAKV